MCTSALIQDVRETFCTGTTPDVQQWLTMLMYDWLVNITLISVNVSALKIQ